MDVVPTRTGGLSCKRIAPAVARLNVRRTFFMGAIHLWRNVKAMPVNELRKMRVVHDVDSHFLAFRHTKQRPRYLVVVSQRFNGMAMSSRSAVISPMRRVTSAAGRFCRASNFSGWQTTGGDGEKLAAVHKLSIPLVSDPRCDVGDHGWIHIPSTCGKALSQVGQACDLLDGISCNLMKNIGVLDRTDYVKRLLFELLGRS